MAPPPLQKIWEAFLEASETAEGLGTALKTGGGSESSHSEYWGHSSGRTLFPWLREQVFAPTTLGRIDVLQVLEEIGSPSLRSLTSSRKDLNILIFSSVQSLSRVQLFATPWTIAHQASLSITNSWNLVKLMSIESVVPSNHFILCHPLFLPPSIFPSIRVFSNQSVLRIRWPKYWSFSFSISPSNEYSGLIFFRMD